MANVYQTVKYVNIVSIGLFCLCFLWSVKTQDTGALTLVEQDVDNEDGVIEDEEDVNTEVFYPTQEWQTIKPGQAIPRGLHVRVNLETGQKEAKLMEGDSGAKYWKQGDKQGMVNTDQKSFTVKELKKALKEFQETPDKKLDDNKDDVKKKYRSMDELKDALKEMNMNMKTDFQIIRELLDRYRKSEITTEEKVSILTDLEYYLHQIDNAQNFVDMGGLADIYKDLNHTSVHVKSEAAFVLGSALQSNPYVQVKALDAGIMQQLIRMLSTEADSFTKSRVIYAISSLVRHFPYAQLRLFELGGLGALKKVFEDGQTNKLRIKAVTLVHDLLLEQHYAEKYSTQDKNQQDKVNQYKQIPLLQNLVEQGWCEFISDLLSIPEHDSREKVISAMKTLVHQCHRQFNAAKSSLEQLKTEYQQLSIDENGDEYFSELLHSVEYLIDTVGIDKTRDEL